MDDLNTKVEVLELDDNKNYGKFAIGPLDRGYGITLGNALRRVLLSSLPGDAISKIKIDKVLHEFTTIPGCVEDVPLLILNIKRIALKKLVDEDIFIDLNIKDIKGTKELKAGDLEVDTNIKIANKDLVLANLNEDADFHIQFKVESGKGYRLSDFNKDENDPIGTIAIDSSFTPVEKVNFKVLDTRVGQMTDFDKLILEVWTNGTISPREAISQGSNILIENLKLFTDLPTEVFVEEEKEEEVPEISQKDRKLLLNLEELDLSLRSYNCLKRNNLLTVEDIISKSRAELGKIRNFGKKSLKEVEEKIENLGLKFKDDDEE